MRRCTSSRYNCTSSRYNSAFLRALTHRIDRFWAQLLNQLVREIKQNALHIRIDTPSAKARSRRRNVTFHAHMKRMQAIDSTRKRWVFGGLGALRSDRKLYREDVQRRMRESVRLCSSICGTDYLWIAWQ